MWEMCVHFEGVRVFLAQTTCILQIEMFFFFIFDSESIQFAAEAWSFFDFGLIRGEKEGLTWGREVV